jgi:hypothetical protein
MMRGFATSFASSIAALVTGFSGVASALTVTGLAARWISGLRGAAATFGETLAGSEDGTDVVEGLATRLVALAASTGLVASEAASDSVEVLLIFFVDLLDCMFAILLRLETILPKFVLFAPSKRNVIPLASPAKMVNCSVGQRPNEAKNKPGLYGSEELLYRSRTRD